MYIAHVENVKSHWDQWSDENRLPQFSAKTIDRPELAALPRK